VTYFQKPTPEERARQRATGARGSQNGPGSNRPGTHGLRIPTRLRPIRCFPV
jgi:hypothetical protein